MAPVVWLRSFVTPLLLIILVVWFWNHDASSSAHLAGEIVAVANAAWYANSSADASTQKRLLRARFLVTIITMPEDFALRQTLRDTVYSQVYGPPETFGEWDVVDFVYRFYVGLPQLRARHSLGLQHTLPEYALKLNANLTKEQQKYGDIIFHPHTDNKYYLTSKRLGAILWAARQNIVDSFDMYIQSDSDTYLSFRKWYHDIRTDLGSDVNLHDLVTNQYFLYGRLNSHPMRGRFKFTDFDKQAVIHPYGHAFVLSVPLVQLIAQYSQYCRTDLQYPLDDVSVGIWVFAVTGLSGYVTNHTVVLNEGKGLYDTNNQRFSFSQLTNDLVMVHHVRARSKFKLLCDAMRQRDEKFVLSAFDS